MDLSLTKQEDQEAQQAPVSSGGLRGDLGENKRKPRAVIKHNNVSHKHNKSGKFLKNIYQSPVSTIISPNQPLLA